MPKSNEKSLLYRILSRMSNPKTAEYVLEMMGRNPKDLKNEYYKVNKDGAAYDGYSNYITDEMAQEIDIKLPDIPSDSKHSGFLIRASAFLIRARTDSETADIFKKQAEYRQFIYRKIKGIYGAKKAKTIMKSWSGDSRIPEPKLQESVQKLQEFQQEPQVVETVEVLTIAEKQKIVNDLLKALYNQELQRDRKTVLKLFDKISEGLNDEEKKKLNNELELGATGLSAKNAYDSIISNLNYWRETEELRNRIDGLTPVQIEDVDESACKEEKKINDHLWYLALANPLIDNEEYCSIRSKYIEGFMYAHLEMWKALINEKGEDKIEQMKDTAKGREELMDEIIKREKEKGQDVGEHN